MMMRPLRITLLLALLAASAWAQPIPDLPALMKEVRAHQLKTDELRENYTFHHIAQVDDLDAKGKVQESTTEESEVFFVKGRRIARLLKKNGKELNEEERKKEDKRINKLVEEEMKRDPAQKPVRGSGMGVSISEILAMARISGARAVDLHGRKTLLFDFTGNPAAHAKDMTQNMAKKMSGTVWIDDAERQVARLEVRFDDNFRLGGGLLASVQKGTAFEVEQSPMGQGLWMQTSSDAHLGARLVVKNFRKNVRTKNVDFQKFDVGMLQQIKPPAK